MPLDDDRSTPLRRPLRPLVPAAFAFASGILLDATLAPPAGGVLIAGLGLVAAGSAFFLFARTRPAAAAGAFASTLALVACAGALNHAAQYRLKRSDALDRVLALEPGRSAIRRVRGRVLDAPLALERALERERVRYVLAAEEVPDRAGAQAASGRFELSLYLDGDAAPELRPGDRVEVRARFRAPSAARRPGAFDYGAYLARKRIGLVASAGSAEAVRVLERRRVPGARARLARLRAALVGAVERALPPREGEKGPSREAALLGAILLGFREPLDLEQKLAFTESGIGHILSVSGLHVMLLVGALWTALSLAGVGPRPRALVLIAFTLLYVAVVGARAPAVRAGVIAVVYMLGLALGREADGRNSLAAAALLLLAWNPAHLFAVGFALSFAAVAFLACLVPLFERAWRARFPLPERLAETSAERRRVALARRLRHGLFASTAAALGSLPLVALVFGVVSPYGILTNLLAIPLASGVLAAGLAVCLLSLALPSAAPLAGWLVRPLLWLLEILAHVVRQVPGATAFVDRPAAWTVALWYALALALFVLAARLPWRAWWRLAAACALLALGALLVTMRPAAPPEGEMRVEVLDLARGGRGALVRAGGARVLLGAGGRGRALSDALRAMRAGRLDAAAVLDERAEEDAGGAVEFLRRCRTGRLLVPRGSGAESEALARARAAARAAGVPVERIAHGRTLALGALRIEVVGVRPPKDRAGSPPPLSARVRSGRRAVFFADLSSARSVRWLLADRARLRADLLVLSVPRYAPQGLAELVGATGARAAVICAAGWQTREEAYDRLLAALAAAGIEPLVTAERGSLRVRLAPEGVVRVEAHDGRAWRPVLLSEEKARGAPPPGGI